MLLFRAYFFSTGVRMEARNWFHPQARILHQIVKRLLRRASR